MSKALVDVSPQSEKLACLEATLESGAPTGSFSRVRPRVLGGG